MHLGDFGAERFVTQMNFIERAIRQYQEYMRDNNFGQYIV